MSQKPPRRTLSDILRANEMIGKKEENEKKKGKSGRWTRRKRTGKSLSQLLEGSKKNKVNKRWTRKIQPKIDPRSDWELDALFAPMPGKTFKEEYDRNHGRDKKGYSNSSNVNSEEFLDGDQLKQMDEILKDAMDGIGKNKKRPRKRKKKAKKSKKQIRKKNRRISRKRGKR